MGVFSSAFYAAVIVITLTLINVLGIKFGVGMQKIMILLQFIGILIIVLAGLFIESSVTMEIPGGHPEISRLSGSSISLALIFVLLTFGGWNEAAYITSELKTGSRNIALGLIISILLSH